MSCKINKICYMLNVLYLSLQLLSCLGSVQGKGDHLCSHSSKPSTQVGAKMVYSVALAWCHAGHRTDSCHPWDLLEFRLIRSKQIPYSTLHEWMRGSCDYTSSVSKEINLDSNGSFKTPNLQLWSPDPTVQLQQSWEKFLVPVRCTGEHVFIL